MAEKVGIPALHPAFIRSLGPAILLFGFHYSNPSVADDVRFIPRASLSIASYNFTQSARPGALEPSTINGGDFPEVEFDVTFKIIGVGGTLFKDSYYLDMMYQQSLDEEDTFSLQDPAIPPDGVFSETFEGDRKDYAVTVGKKFLDNLAGLYLGYKVGESDATGDQGERLNFKEDGFFIGGNYGWRINNSGVLSVNLAYADLDGDLEEKVNNPLFSPTLSTDASSDAKGLSYGISWASRLTDKLSYSLALDTRKYTFKNVKSNDRTLTPPSDEFEEKFFSASASIYYLF